MPKKILEYDYNSHRLFLNSGINKRSRRRKREINIGPGVLNHPRIFVLVVVITALTGLFLKESRQVLANNTVFTMKNIIVNNTGVVDRREVCNMLGIKKDTRIFAVSVRRLAEKLEQDPDIEKASIEKCMPCTLKVTINERIPYAAVDTNGKHIYISHRGRILLRKRAARHLPLITGLAIRNSVPGKLCADPKLKEVLSILQAGDRMKWGMFIEPVKADLSRNGYIILYTRERILIKMTADNVKTQISRLVKVLEDISERGVLVKSIDTRFGDVYVE